MRRKGVKETQQLFAMMKEIEVIEPSNGAKA